MLISNVTDAVLEEVKAWQSRPLASVYPILYFDALFLKARFPQLGRAVDFREFWQDCLKTMRLGQAMAWLDGEGVVVP